MSPARRAITVAAFVVAVALALYTVAAMFDRWPSLVIASWGAALGAGMAINGVARREMDFHNGAAPDRWAAHRRGATRHQLCAAMAAIGAWQTAETEHVAWAALTVVSGVLWAWTLPALVSQIERASPGRCLSAYARAFQLFAVAIAIGAIYASIALETPWLWRPSVPADLQGVVWLAILEFAGLPLTLVAATSPPA